MGIWASSVRKARRGLATENVKLRFLVVGGLNTCFGLLIFPLLMWLMTPWHVPYMAPLVISHPIAIVFSFLTTKFITFRSKGRYLSEFSKFGTFYVLNFILNIAALPALVEFAGMHPIPAQLMFASLVIVTSYFWHSRITFPSRELPNGKE
jgi:putative flippase GtrA